jgi:threonine dehydrogenase-like Zn-dependent dehydrogenase
MRALVLREFGEMVVQERPEPECGAGEVVLAVAATGICGSDLHGFTGENGRRRPGQVMGHETAGRVVAVGAGVDLPVGTLATINPVLSCGACAACAAGREQACPTKRVIGVDPAISSAFAEYVVAPAGNVVPLPAGMPVEHGALVEPLAVAYHAVRRGDATATDRVLVVGGGPIGQSVVLACRRVGVTGVVVSELDRARRGLCRALGAEVLDPAEEGLPDRVAAVLGGPATLAVDAVGNSATLANALACTEPGARVVLVGMHTPQVSFPAYDVSTAERSIIGSFCYSAEDFASTAAWAGTADLTTLVENQVALDAAPDAFRDLAGGGTAAGKVLVRFGAGT